jgi:hypothetical protein
MGVDDISVRLPLKRYEQLLEYERAYVAQMQGLEKHECNAVARMYNMRGGKIYTLGKYSPTAWCLHVTPFHDPDAESNAALIIDQTDAHNLAVSAFIITGQAFKRSWLLRVAENAREARKSHQNGT